MKRSFLLYGFLFSVLINIFQYVNATRILNKSEKVVQQSKKQVKIARDSIKLVNEQNFFSLEQNEEAQDYFHPADFMKVKAKVQEDINELNTAKKGNKLVPYEPINGSNFIIDKVKFLNHRWLIANYSDGTVWGEVLIKYFHNEDKPTDFETIETVMYTK